MGWLAQGYFYGCAAFAVAGAIITISARNPIRGAMGLLAMILSVAGLFLALHAQFLAVIQLIVYAGAIVVLFLFVIMLLGPSAVSPRDNRGMVARTFGGALFAIVMLGVVVAAGRKMTPMAFPKGDTDFGSIDAFGRSLFSDGLVPFELSSALLMVAVLGAVAVARGKQGEPAHTLPNTQPGMIQRPGGSTPAALHTSEAATAIASDAPALAKTDEAAPPAAPPAASEAP